MLTLRSSALRSYAGQVALPGGKADEGEGGERGAWRTARREAWEEVGLPMGEWKDGGWRVEELCELPANLAKTEVVVRPCVAVLHRLGSTTSSADTTDTSTTSSSSSSSNHTTSSADTTVPPTPHLDPKEVAAVFTAPLRAFLHTTWPPGSSARAGNAPWYQGVWTEWHGGRWRMHNFYVPRGRGMGMDGEGEGVDADAPETNTQETKPDTHPPTPDSSPQDPSPDPAATYRVFGMTARILVDAARVAYAREPDFEHNSHFGDEALIGRLLAAGRLGGGRGRAEETGEGTGEGTGSKL